MYSIVTLDLRQPKTEINARLASLTLAQTPDHGKQMVFWREGEGSGLPPRVSPDTPRYQEHR